MALTARWGEAQAPLISQFQSTSGGVAGRGHERPSLLGSDPRARVSEVSFKGSTVLMWLLLYLLKEGKQASGPFLPQDGSSDPRDAPPPLTHVPLQSV